MDNTTHDTYLVALDFSKAFDKVPYNKLILKLINKKMPKWFIAWVLAYLTDRRQRVKLLNSISMLKEISSGVPQGSVIGPALFTFFAADLQATTTNCSLIKYADDTCIIIRVLKGDDYTDAINTEISKVENWSHNNLLTLNKDKTKCMQMGYRRHKAKPSDNPYPTSLPNFVNSIKVLGVFIDHGLTWREHINYVVKKQAKLLYILRTLRKMNVNHNKLLIVYNSLINSICTYSSPCFTGLNISLNDKLESIHRRSHRIICGESCLIPDCNFRTSIRDQRMEFSIKLFNKIAATPSSLNHNCIPPTLPNTKKFISPKARTSWKLNSFFCMVGRHLNSTSKSSS
jgi:hypothetical protein